MSKRATKKAAKWVPKVGDKVTMKGTVTSYSKLGKCFVVDIEDDGHLHYVDTAALRPAVEVFAWSPKKQPTTKGAKKK
jgi:hypothetical protein